MICVLHQINLAAAAADQMLLLDEGRAVVAMGHAEEVMTADNLSHVYGMPLRVTPHPITGRPQAQTMVGV